MYRWQVPRVLVRRLVRVRARTGVPVTRQLRRALVEYLDQHEASAPRPRRAAAITTTRGRSEG